MPCPEIFSKNHSRKNTPLVIGPEPKNFKTIFDRGITLMDRLKDTPPGPKGKPGDWDSPPVIVSIINFAGNGSGAIDATFGGTLFWKTCPGWH